ncbi:hypothetical protein D9M68_725140 [compost metagenome]
MEIELVDLGPAADSAGLFQADRAQRRHAEHGTELACGRGHGAFAVMMEESLQRGRRAIHRQRQFLPHDGYRHVHLRHPAQHVRHQVAGLEGLGIAPVGGFIVGRAVDVIEDRARQALARHTAKVVEILALVQAHQKTFINAAGGAGGPRE